MENNETMSNTSLDAEQQLEMIQQTRNLKKTLKQLGKNQLIMLVLQQVNLVVEQQNINKVLLERLKELEKKEEPKNA